MIFKCCCTDALCGFKCALSTQCQVRNVNMASTRRKLAAETELAASLVQPISRRSNPSGLDERARQNLTKNGPIEELRFVSCEHCLHHHASCDLLNADSHTRRPLHEWPGSDVRLRVLISADWLLHTNIANWPRLCPCPLELSINPSSDWPGSDYVWFPTLPSTNSQFGALSIFNSLGCFVYTRKHAHSRLTMDVTSL